MHVARPSSVLLAFAPFLLVARPCAQVDAETAAAIKKEGLEQSRVMDTLDRLTNGIGHRLTGSDNFTRACAWARDEFKSYGIEQVELEQWDTWPYTWNREQWMGRILTPEPMDLQVATPAWTNGTKGAVRGDVVAIPADLDEFKARAGDLAGKWLFGRMPNSRTPDYAQWMKAGTAARIAGFLESSAGDEANPNRIRVFGDREHMRASDVFERPPHVVVRRDQAQKIREMLGKGDAVTGEFEIRNRWTKRPIEIHNVVAEIKGQELPDEYVVVSAHLDSWHQATGTTDNGTGAVSTLESARILAAIGARPKRTIRFCLWGGEEQGLLGSAKHTQMRRAQMANVSAVFNHDTGTNWAHGLSVTTEQEAPMRAVLGPVFELAAPETAYEEPVFQLRTLRRLGSRGGSDDASFLAVGVPAFNWSLTGRSDYFSHTWHSQWDTYDAAIPEYMRHTSTVIALTVLGVANLPEKLSRESVGGGNPLADMIGSAYGMELDEKDPLKIVKVNADGIAAKIGFLAGDRIQKVGGKELKQLEDFSSEVRTLREAQATGAVEIVVRRADAETTLQAPVETLRELGNRRRRGGRGGDAPAEAPAPAGSGTTPGGAQNGGTRR
ncbi:MAG: M20/M25/M40 family metallo-hydrolase [Planctomycetes bacterium]|nr:M20/M25/M40 family metallo-hydrolase [Planctomycetota bacterium]